MKKNLSLFLCSLIIFCLLVAGRGPSYRMLAGDEKTQYIGIPDYAGNTVRIISTNDNQRQLGLITSDCNPNSVAFNQDRLYVVCNKDWGNGDKILIYNFQDLVAARAQGLNISPIQSISNAEFDGLVAAAFDSQGALWVSSYYNNQIFRFTNSSLNSGDPKIDKKLIHSPDNPVGLTFDTQDNSLWVVGHYAGGIVIKIPSWEIDSPGENINGVSVINAQPVDCFSNSADGCKHFPGLFDKPEGIAVLNNEIWVSNNGGNQPAASLVRLRPDEAQAVSFGGGVGNPFSCPGGLASDGSRLWINDQSLGQVNTACGAGDAQAGVDGVLIYDQAALSNPSSIGIPLGVLRGVTSRPGFGGITIFSSSIQF